MIEYVGYLIKQLSRIQFNAKTTYTIVIEKFWFEQRNQY